ncbi:MAG: helix-turn-helix transcriptional regulator [Thermogemmatispora sp.]|jgi:transcriptional regulator with XRE-family HTH domain|uniref:HTH cro/C1-type domain-containing protein n=1 Tax=Thermogemmatispora aurantia TaxID=2045279 RepID=A0A5J4KH32_9CHLR|nr:MULTISPECIES: helix-turn-helix transcriptional regulator [Thermogemmatispora]MBE3566261.1 helix-turn-helix transcriptional regulator [Thermogemmatispora sp.]GER85620.1 hypothetical protein KTAU_42540 [Thermogemmatispora aurantia]
MKDTEEVLKRFGQRLRQKRQERGFTREKFVDQMDKFASESGQSRKAPDVSTVARWERGEQCPRESHLRLVCGVLQVTPEELGYPKPIRHRP